mgnify:CR=1 FL=1
MTVPIASFDHFDLVKSTHYILEDIFQQIPHLCILLPERVIPLDEFCPGHEDVLVLGEQPPELGPVLAAVLLHGGPHLIPELALPVRLNCARHGLEQIECPEHGLLLPVHLLLPALLLHKLP